jgi:hypothetical protein
MPLINKAVLLDVADRAAYQYQQIDTVMAAIRAVGGGLFFDLVSATEDPDVEIPCDASYHEVDQDLQTALAVKAGTRLANIVFAMDAHFNRLDGSGQPLQAGGWDGFLHDEDERVSYYFARLYYDVKGYYMLANNVFSESVNQFARVQVAAGPSITFTDGINYGDGSDQNPANGTYYAATQLKVVVTTMGVSNLDLRLSVKDKNNNPTTVDVTVPGGSSGGAVVNIGSSLDRFLDVTGVIFKPSGSTGTVGDDVRVYNLKERQIAL